MAKTSESVPVKSGRQDTSKHPISDLRRDIESVFDRFMSGWPTFKHGDVWDPFKDFQHSAQVLSPSVDVTETDTGYEIEAELPGLDQKDIELTLTDNILTLKGEKKQEREEKKKEYSLSERSYGSFQRSFRLPDDSDLDKLSTTFRNGVLKISLPKSAEAQTRTRKIEVNSA